MLSDFIQLALWEYRERGKFGFWLWASCIVADQLAELRGRREVADA